MEDEWEEAKRPKSMLRGAILMTENPDQIPNLRDSNIDATSRKLFKNISEVQSQAPTPNSRNLDMMSGSVNYYSGKRGK